jgi:hypothetical protein
VSTAGGLSSHAVGGAGAIAEPWQPAVALIARSLRRRRRDAPKIVQIQGVSRITACRVLSFVLECGSGLGNG